MVVCPLYPKCRSDPVYGLAVNMLLSYNVMQVSFLPILCFVQHTMRRKLAHKMGRKPENSVSQHKMGRKPNSARYQHVDSDHTPDFIRRVKHLGYLDRIDTFFFPNYVP